MSYIFHNLLSLEESYVYNGRVEVDELKNKYFEYQVIVKIWLRPMHLWKTMKKMCIDVLSGRCVWAYHIWLIVIKLILRKSINVYKMKGNFINTNKV